MRIILLRALAATLRAQEPAFHLDLSEPWRIHTGNNPAFAQPNFDDSGWPTVSAPFPPQRPIGFWWLRRTVTLPDWLAAGTPLALSTGAFNQVLEGFANGQRIGSIAALLHHVQGAFVTCSVALFEGGPISPANAGHTNPYLNGRELNLPPGLPLGIAPNEETARACGQNDDITVITVRGSAA